MGRRNEKYHPLEVARDAVGTPKMFRIFDLGKNIFFYTNKSNKSSKRFTYKGILTFWRLEKNPHENSGMLVQKSLTTDNSLSSYDILGFNMTNHG